MLTIIPTSTVSAEVPATRNIGSPAMLVKNGKIIETNSPFHDGHRAVSNRKKSPLKKCMFLHVTCTS